MSYLFRNRPAVLPGQGAAVELPVRFVAKVSLERRVWVAAPVSPWVEVPALPSVVVQALVQVEALLSLSVGAPERPALEIWLP